MAYIVLAVGAVMALLGALAIVTGYPIIQIERGWATVIAGTTLLAGGLLTMALGLVLRAVMDVRATLANVAAALPGYGVSATYAAPHAEPTFRSEPNHAPEETRPNYGSTALGAAAIAVPVAALAMTRQPEPEPPRTEDEPVHPVAAYEHVETEHHDAPPAPVAHEPVSSPPIDDWLDKAFADLSLDSTLPAKDVHRGPSTQVEPEHLHPEHVTAQHDGEILFAEDHPTATHPAEPYETHGDETHLADAAHDPAHRDAEHEVHVGYEEPAHADPVSHDLEPLAEPEPASSHDSAVIGRYEADGTAYTMYADGSIEAQSDAGIYRFASMADLKAFIES